MENEEDQNKELIENKGEGKDLIEDMNFLENKEIENTKSNNNENGKVIKNINDFSQTEKNNQKDLYIEEIKKLKQELSEKNNILIELQNEDNPEFKIAELFGKIEAKRLLEYSNEQKINQQKTKIESIKNMVKNLDEQFKHQLKMKEHKINKKLEPFVNKNNDLIQEINLCKEQMIQLNERLEKGNDNYENLKKEKSEMEELIIKREEQLNVFYEKLNIFEEMIKKKSKLLKENELYSKELIKIVEEQKDVIKSLENKNKNNKKNYSSGTNYINNNERYNDLGNNQLNNEETYNADENNNHSKSFVLPNIYNNEEVNKNNDINYSKISEKGKNNMDDFDLGNEINEEKNIIKFKEFKDLVDDLYNNATC